MTITLNGTTGITDVNGTAAAPAITGTDTDSGMYFGTNTVGLATNGTQAMLANASQGVQFANAIGLGATTPTTSGSGVTFPATQSASSDANTLDDYEEGTFTVAVRGSTTVGTYTITSQSCSYIKIGRLVYLIISISGFSAASGGTGYMQITGLPFANTGAVPGVLRANLLDYSAGALWVVPAFITSSGTTTLYLEEMRDNGNSVDFSIGGVSTSTTSVLITISYQV